MPLLPPQILTPQGFHGFNARAPFFEGWYVKVVDASRRHRFAVIPGIFLDPAGVDSHAFVQTLDGLSGETRYHRYPLHDFVAHPSRFRIRVGPSFFSSDEIALNIAPDDPAQRLVGVLRFHGVQGWPVSLASPGIMGWYSYVPLMECYHGVLGFDHGVTGQLIVGTESIDFNRGRGYMEKDWGQAFPQAWVWMQSNHFSRLGISITASVARTPWLGSAFRGFIVGLWLDGELYRFASYTGATIERFEVHEGRVDLSLRGPVRLSGSQRIVRLNLSAERSNEKVDLLHAPFRTAMLQRVLESLTATISVRLETDEGAVIFDERGDCAGLELGGNLASIL